MFGNTEIKAYPQLELVSLCYSQACNTAVLFFPAGHRGGGRKDAGGEGALHGSSFSIRQQTPGHVLHSVTWEGAVAQSLESPPETHIIWQLQGMTSPDQRFLWLKTPARELPREGCKAVQGNCELLTLSFTACFLSRNLAAANNISQHAINKFSSAPFGSSQRLKAEAACSSKMDAIRCPASVFSRLHSKIIVLSIRTFPHVLVCRGNQAGQLIPGTKTPGMAASQTTQLALSD